MKKKKKIAVVNCCDTGPLESLYLMLREAGYETMPLSVDCVEHLRSLGLDNVNPLEWAQHFEGVEPPSWPGMRRADRGVLLYCDLYVDVKGHRNGPKLWVHHPRLKPRTLWYRINGGKPENCGHGEEVNPPCPVLTPNLWYREANRAYTCWPPFMRFEEHAAIPRSRSYKDPICLVHNLNGWGYGKWADTCRNIGVKIHGRDSPDGLIKHDTLKALLSVSLAMVHLKQSDAPGYALYESLSSACPLVVSERLVQLNRMEDLLVDEETCLYFDRLSEPDLTHSNLSPDDPEILTAVGRIHRQLVRLQDPEFNEKIGRAGQSRLKSLMWNSEQDGAGLRAFFERNFPC